MEDVNPYRLPAESWSRIDLPLSKKSYSPHSCPYCLADVTFWKNLKQNTPFRYKCPDCRSTCQIRSPRMGTIFAGICVATVLLLSVCVAAVFEYGLIVVLTAVPLYIGWCLALELWLSSYIRHKGAFIVVGAGEVPEPSFLEARQRQSDVVESRR